MLSLLLVMVNCIPRVLHCLDGQAIQMTGSDTILTGEFLDGTT